MTKRKTGNSLVLALVDFCETLSKISLLLFALCVIYLTMVFFGENIRRFNQLKPDEQTYYFNAIKNVLFVFKYSGYATIIFSTIAYFKSYIYGRIFLFFSVLFAYGLPYLFIYLTQAQDFHKYYFLNDIVYIYSHIGKIALFVAIIVFIKDICVDVSVAYSRFKISSKNKVKAVKRSGKIGNHCWDSGYCLSEIKAICPAARQKKSCWKIKMGCCDEALFLIAADNAYSKELLKYMDLPKMSEADKAERCRKCHIYLMHQKRKYKTLFPITIAVATAVGYLLYKSLWQYLEHAILSIDKFANFLVPHSESIADIHYALPILVGFTVALSILTIISLFVQFLHYLIFKLKI